MSDWHYFSSSFDLHPPHNKTKSYQIENNERQALISVLLLHTNKRSLLFCRTPQEEQRTKTTNTSTTTLYSVEEWTSPQLFVAGGRPSTLENAPVLVEMMVLVVGGVAWRTFWSRSCSERSTIDIRNPPRDRSILGLTHDAYPLVESSY